jgi:hypothetical protein
MAVGVIYEPTGVNAESYKQLASQFHPDNKPAKGMLYHVAGPAGTGFVVIEIWESREALDKFASEVLAGPLKAAGVDPRPRYFDVVNTMK